MQVEREAVRLTRLQEYINSELEIADSEKEQTSAESARVETLEEIQRVVEALKVSEEG